MFWQPFRCFNFKFNFGSGVPIDLSLDGYSSLAILPSDTGLCIIGLESSITN